MVSLGDLKTQLVSMIQKRKRVTADELLKWCEEQKVGRLLLYIALREILTMRGFRGSGERVIASIRAGGQLTNLVIPSIIEVAASPVETTRVTTRKARHAMTGRKGASILDVLIESQEPKRESASLQQAQKTQEVKQGQEAVALRPVETQVKAKAEVEAKQENTRALVEVNYVSLETKDFLELLKNSLKEELGEEIDEAFKVAIEVLQYLARYWSVGELRLKQDITRKLSMDQERAFNIIDGVLKALRRMGIIEIVEPGVINRIKDLPSGIVRVRLDSLLLGG